VNSELSSLWLFFLALAKTSLLCGVGPGIAVIFLYVQVRGGQLALSDRKLIPAESWATIPPRKIKAWRTA
jgi:hypothetical protein